MSSEFTNKPGDDNEVRITALLLGELPDDEAAELREAIKQDADLAKLHDQLAGTLGLVREAATSDEESEPLQLSSERRARLLQAFKTVRPKQFAPRARIARREVMSMAAMFLILALLTGYLVSLPANRRLRPERVTPIPGLRAGAVVDQSPDNIPAGGETYAFDPQWTRLKSPPVEFDAEGQRVLSESRSEAPVSAVAGEAARESVRRWAEEAATRGIRVQGGTAPEQKAENQPAAPQSGGGGFGGGGAGGVNRFRGRVDYLEDRQAGEKRAVEDSLRLSDFFAPYQKVDGDDSGVDPSTSQTAAAATHHFKSGSNGEFLSENLDAKKSDRDNPIDVRFGVLDHGTHIAGAITAATNWISGLVGGVVTDTNGASLGWHFNSAAPGQQAAARYYHDANRNLESLERSTSSGINIYSVNAVGYVDVSGVAEKGKLDSRSNLGRVESAGKEIGPIVINELNYSAPEVAAANKRVDIVLPQVRQEDSVYKDEIRETEDRRKVEVGTLPPLPKASTLAPARKPVPVDPATGLPAAEVAEESGEPALKAAESELLVLQQRMNLDKTRGLDIATQLKKTFDKERTSLALAELNLRRATDTLQRTKELFGTGDAASSADSNVLHYEAAKRSRDKYDLEVKQRKELVSKLEENLQPLTKEGIVAATPFDKDVDAAIQRQQEVLKSQQPQKELDEEARKPKASTPAPIPQPEVQTQENPFSTFSLNVSDVSFKLAAASLEKGLFPEAATIRSEEFINAFDYRDAEPAPGVPVAFAWERARYPFAHNRDLLRFSIKTAATGRQAGRPVNLVLLLDNSGSMERADRVSIIRECVRVLGNQLQAEDRVSVVAFSRTPRLWIDGLAGTQGGELAQRVGNLAPEGGTNMEEGMNLAYETARRHFVAHGINRVVLLTDGAANLGNVEPESLKKKVEAHRKQGIALDCFGIGWEGYNDDLLEVLSRNGDGRYGFVNSPEAAATEFAGQLVGALQVAASDVKVQVEFNPRRVTTYRQIGYAKHQLQKEQFRDNTVDAAEIAAAEAGNALYVIQVDPRGEGPIGVVRVRYKIPGTTDYREHEWSVPASGAVAPLDQAGHAIRLAGVAAAFSEWLARSPFGAEVAPERLLSCLTGVGDIYGADPRPKKLEWMIRQSMSIAGNR